MVKALLKLKQFSPKSVILYIVYVYIAVIGAGAVYIYCMLYVIDVVCCCRCCCDSYMHSICCIVYMAVIVGAGAVYMLRVGGVCCVVF